MARMPSLREVAREWERDDQLRGHLHRCKSLLQWDDPSTKKINIKNADLNFRALKPLAMRLRDSQGDVGMVCLPQVTSQ